MTLAEIAARHDVARQEDCTVPLSIAALICDDVPALIGWVRRLVERAGHTPGCPSLAHGDDRGPCSPDPTICGLEALLAEVRG